MTKGTLNRDVLKAKELRDKRKPLLEAWDIAKGNILIGVDVVTAERMEYLKEWYRDVLDLDETAINIVPKEIMKYKATDKR